MCEPWGSFLVDRVGQIYAKDGILSHTQLLEVFTTVSNVSRFSSDVFKPEFNWLHRRLDDFHRHDLESIPGSRTCQAVDSYVESQFGSPERLFHWFERGNWLPAYEREYAKLLQASCQRGRLAWSEKLPPCTHKDKWEMVTHLAVEKLATVVTLKCPVCVRHVSHMLTHKYLDALGPAFRAQKFQGYLYRKLSHKMAQPIMVFHEADPEAVSLGQFADFWKKPENRIEVWRN